MIPSGGLLHVLVEDPGRVDYGRRIGESKGLTDLKNLDLDGVGPLTALATELDGRELAHPAPFAWEFWSR